MNFQKRVLTFVTALLEATLFSKYMREAFVFFGERWDGSDKEICVQSVTMEARGPEESLLDGIIFTAEERYAKLFDCTRNCGYFANFGTWVFEFARILRS